MLALTPQAKVCMPHYTNQLKESITKSFGKAERFYRKNRGKLLYEIGGDTPKAILKDFLRPYHEGTAFSCHREHYRNVLDRFNSYFDRLYQGTLNHLGERQDIIMHSHSIGELLSGCSRKEEEDRSYDRLFNQFRFILLNLVQTTAESIDIWYKRTELWD